MSVQDALLANDLLQTEEFVVCPNCGIPLLKANLINVKGAAHGKNYCASCHFEIGLCFEGTPAAEEAGNVDKDGVFYENALGRM
nr:hypothetical protein [uncultured Schaedlerella sp.]